MQLREFNKYFDFEEIEIPTPKRTLLQRVIGLFPTASIKRDYEYVLNKMEAPDYIYIRRFVADKKYICFLKKIKELYPECKILVEVFTYPYDKDDFGKWNAWPFLIKELIYRKKQKKYIDRFVTFTPDEEIFGIKAISTFNGIDVDSIKMAEGQFSNKEIHLMGVAYMQRHHGYERLIKGLADYYSKLNVDTEVFLDLVGDGPEKEMYQNLVNECNLSKYVTFYPNTNGDELDKLFDKCDIAVSSLGLYKLGLLGKAGVLKSREYLARGLMMLLGSEIDILDDDYIYAIMFDNDDSIIDIKRVVEFYKNMTDRYSDKQVLSQTLREFAYETVDNSVTMRPIIDYLRG